MPCDLTEEELNMLYYLYCKRNLSIRASRSIEAIERDLSERMDVEQVLQDLMNVRLVGQKKKKKMNYWAKAGEAIRILEEHGYPISRNGRHRL